MCKNATSGRECVHKFRVFCGLPDKARSKNVMLLTTTHFGAQLRRQAASAKAFHVHMFDYRMTLKKIQTMSLRQMQLSKARALA